MAFNSYKSWLSIIPVGAHTRASAGTVLTITLTEDSSVLLIEADDADVRYTIDGTTPTADIGFLLETSDNVVRLDLYPGAQVKVLGVGGSVNYQQCRIWA